MAIIYSYPRIDEVQGSDLILLADASKRNQSKSASVTQLFSVILGGDDNYIPKFSGTELVNSAIYEDSSGNIGIGTLTPGSNKLNVAGTGLFTGQVTIPETPVANTDAASKGYVDTLVTAQDLDFAGTTGTGAVDLDSQTFTIQGTANEIETSAASQTLTIGLPDDVTVSGLLSVGGVLTLNNSNVTQTNSQLDFLVGTLADSMLQLNASPGDWSWRIGEQTSVTTITGNSGSGNIDITSSDTVMARFNGITPTNSFIKLGGFGAANTLDDYEEGTFNPTLVVTGTSTSISDKLGRYTKIGNMVHVEILIRDFVPEDQTTTIQSCTNLPFTIADTIFTSYATGTLFNSSSFNTGRGLVYGIDNTITITFYDNGLGTSLPSDDSTSVSIYITYTT